MKILSKIVSNTIGKFSPQHRTLNQWIDVYQSLLDVKDISAKTKANMRPTIDHLRKTLGDSIISKISPMDVSNFVLQFKDTPSTAKRRLNETKRVFHDAVCYGWLNHSPAETIKSPKVKVIRKRLKLEDWKKIYQWSKDNQPKWCHIAFELALVSGQRRGDIVNIKFSDIKDGYIYINQGKTGSKIALPLELELSVIGRKLGDIVIECLEYARHGETLIRKNNGSPICPAYLSSVFENARDHATSLPTDRTAPSFHEIRSLAERLYRCQGIDTKTLLGHKHQYVTDIYNDPRNDELTSFKRLKI